MHKKHIILVVLTTLIILTLLCLGSSLFLTPLDRLVTQSFFPSKTQLSGTPDINIEYLRGLTYDSAAPQIVEELPDGSNYKQYIVSYISDGNKLFGLLTVPTAEMPDSGYSAIVFNHGYIPPNQYVTTEKYVAYVDYLARSGFVVFKIDMRGHGNSEGTPVSSYTSAGYTIDALNAVSSLQKLDYVNPDKIGMWGHSMSGNLTLRAMLVDKDIKAGVIWAGAVYSYEDFIQYRLHDISYISQQQPTPQDYQSFWNQESSDIPSVTIPGVSNPIPVESTMSKTLTKLRRSSNITDFSSELWEGIILTKNLQYLQAPIQLHHAIDDPTVNIGYSRDLVEILKENNKNYSFYEYPGGGHNISSPYFEQAMQRTVEFFKDNL